jgi:hypothetical protein
MKQFFDVLKNNDNFKKEKTTTFLFFAIITKILFFFFITVLSTLLISNLIDMSIINLNNQKLIIEGFIEKNKNLLSKITKISSFLKDSKLDFTLKSIIE